MSLMIKPIDLGGVNCYLLQSGERTILIDTGFAARRAKLVREQPFKPDFAFAEDDSLAAYGIEADVVYLPGHSKGSVGFLTAEGELFCGDLLYNFFARPTCHLIDDMAEWAASIEKLATLSVKTVYPGHGQPFAFERFLQHNPLKRRMVVTSTRNR